MAHLRTKTWVAGLALSATLVLAGGSAVLGQDSPANQKANIVAGSCAELGTTSAFSLRDVTPNDPRVGGSFSGQSSAIGVLTSETEIRTRLSNLLNSPHAIVIGDLASPLACGDIGGFTRGIVDNDEIEIGVAAIGDSGHFGIASLEGDGDEVEIDLYIAAPLQ